MSANSSLPYNIFGRWQAHPISDQLPLLESAFNEISPPFSSLLLDQDELIIERAGPQGSPTEEVSFLGRLHSPSVGQRQALAVYQIGAWNVMQYVEGKVVGGICFFVGDAVFVVRQGPRPNAQSLERYSASADGKHLFIDIAIQDGYLLSMRKVLARISSEEIVHRPKFPYSLSSAGWSTPSNHNSDCLRDVVAVVTDFKRIRGPAKVRLYILFQFVYICAVYMLVCCVCFNTTCVL